MTQPAYRNRDLSSDFFFVGRAEFLATIRTTLLQSHKAAITGISGIGKTAVVRKYTQDFAQDYQFICWINMATDETLLADLLAAMYMLSLPINMVRGISGLFQDLQQHLFTRQDFLIVLDNVPPSFEIRELPGSRRMAGHLLLIARSFHAPPQFPCLELAGLDAQDGALLVLHRAGWLDSQATLGQAEEEQRLAALELARELHGQPIALTLAGGDLHETRGNVQDYLLAFRESPTQLRPPVDSTDPEMQEIAVACELSLTRLKQARSTALELLQIGALLLPEAIPEFLFQQGSEPASHPAKEGSDPAKENMQSLLVSGLLTTNQETSTLSTHPLVQHFVRQFFALDRPQQQIEQALRLFQQSLPSLEAESSSARLRVAGHIRHLEQLSRGWPLFIDEAAETFSWAASRLGEQGLIYTAEPLLRRALAIWDSIHGDAHPKVAAILDNLATLNGLLKNFVEAEALSHRAIASKSKALGVNHPDVLLALDHLGHTYAEQGKLQEARLCYEKALSIGDRVGLYLHPIYNTVRYDLALFYIEQKQFAQAEPLLLKVCVVWERTQEPQDPLLMAARFSLAEVFTRLQNWKRAARCYQQALPVCEKLLGPKHPVTLGHLERAAAVSFQSGNLDEAGETWQRVLKTREQSPDTPSTDIVRCLNGLAQVALAQKQVASTLALLEQARKIYADQPESMELAATLDTLAEVQKAEQNYELAISTSKRALEIRKRILGKEHQELIANLHNLAEIYQASGESQPAEGLLLQALYIYQSKEKPEDLELVPVLNSLARIEIQRQQFDKARMYLQRVRAIRELALGQADPLTVEVIQKIAEIAQTPK